MDLSMIITNYTVFNEAQLLYSNFFSSLQVLNQPLQYLYEDNEMEDNEMEDNDTEDDDTEDDDTEDNEMEDDDTEDNEMEDDDTEAVEQIKEQVKDFSKSTAIQNSNFNPYLDLYIPNNYCPSFTVKWNVY